MLYESTYYGVVGLGETLMHHGIKGQHWGHRRWQNNDGSLTPEGYIHYGVGHGRNKAKTDKDSGRYPKGSGASKEVSKRSIDDDEKNAIRDEALDDVRDAVKDGANADKAIAYAAKTYGVSEDELRSMYNAARDKRSDNEVSEEEKNKVRAETTNDPKLYNALMKEKYKLIDIPPNKNAAWDNARDMYNSGASKEEIEKYLKLNKLPEDASYAKLKKEEDDFAVSKARARGDDYTVGAGAETQRFTTNRDEMPGDERKYVSLTDKDKQIYKDFYASNLAVFENYKKTKDYGFKTGDRDILSPHVYETTLSTIKDMKVAGARTYNDTFMELYNDPAIRKQAGWQKTEKGKLYTAVFGKSLRELQARQATAARNAFDYDLQVSESQSAVNKAFLNKLREKGYDAVEDQFSKKVDRTEGNLIVLNPNQSLKKTSNNVVKFGEGYTYEGTMTLAEAKKRANASSAMQKQIISTLESAKRQGKNMSEVADQLADKYNVSLATIDYVYGKRKKTA